MLAQRIDGLQPKSANTIVIAIPELPVESEVLIDERRRPVRRRQRVDERRIVVGIVVGELRRNPNRVGDRDQPVRTSYWKKADRPNGSVT